MRVFKLPVALVELIMLNILIIAPKLSQFYAYSSLKKKSRQFGSGRTERKSHAIDKIPSIYSINMDDSECESEKNKEEGGENSDKDEEASDIRAEKAV